MSDGRWRKLALALPGAEESSHFGKPDFRVKGKIFAGFNDKGEAYVKLTPGQQDLLCSAESQLIRPIPGGWGRKGWTLVEHTSADEPLLKSLLLQAWKNVAPKKLQA